MLHIRQRNTQGCTSKFVSLNEIENLLTKLQRWLPALPPLSKWFLYSFIDMKKNKNNNIFLIVVNVKTDQIIDNDVHITKIFLFSTKV